MLHGHLFRVRATKLLRRRFLHLAVSAAALPAMSRMARAQAYPTRPVRLIVGFAPGGGADLVARLMGQWLSERLGQPFVIENRPGAGGNIAAEAVVRAAPDGYTLLLTLDANAINATLYDKLNFNLTRDIAPVAGIIRAPFVMVVNPWFPATTVPKFIAYAKANLGNSTWRRAALEAETIWLASCLRSWLASTWFTCPIAVKRLHIPICSAGRFR